MMSRDKYTDKKVSNQDLLDIVTDLAKKDNDIHHYQILKVL